MKKVVIFSAPSGSGKSTIIRYLLERGLGLEFSVSATSRPPRGKEEHGKEYYFFSQQEFKRKIEEGAFWEWEEVYEACYYGTLTSELERIWNQGRVVLFDVDVKGGLAIKKIMGDDALAIFIQPPSIEALRSRLEKRGTDSAGKIEERVNKAAFEMSFSGKFDAVIVNDNLQEAERAAEQKIKEFIARSSR